jgi:preprotein translocase subunit SecY
MRIGLAGLRERSLYKELKRIIPTAAAFVAAILELLPVAPDWACGINGKQDGVASTKGGKRHTDKNDSSSLFNTSAS